MIDVTGAARRMIRERAGPFRHLLSLYRLVWIASPSLTLASMGLRYIVSLFPNSETKPQGWIQLGGSNFFAYPLQGPVDAATASSVEEFHPTP